MIHVFDCQPIQRRSLGEAVYNKLHINVFCDLENVWLLLIWAENLMLNVFKLLTVFSNKCCICFIFIINWLQLSQFSHPWISLVTAGVLWLVFSQDLNVSAVFIMSALMWSSRCKESKDNFWWLNSHWKWWIILLLFWQLTWLGECSLGMLKF